MEKIIIIGDVHTVSAFRMGGAEGIVSSREDAAGDLDRAIEEKDSGIVLITHDLARETGEAIRDCNLYRDKPVVIEIPGIFDLPKLTKSIARYISEALGVSL